MIFPWASIRPEFHILYPFVPECLQFKSRHKLKLPKAELQTLILLTETRCYTTTEQNTIIVLKSLQPKQQIWALARHNTSAASLLPFTQQPCSIVHSIKIPVLYYFHYSYRTPEFKLLIFTLKTSCHSTSASTSTQFIFHSLFIFFLPAFSFTLSCHPVCLQKLPISHP